MDYNNSTQKQLVDEITRLNNVLADVNKRAIETNTLINSIRFVVTRDNIQLKELENTNKYLRAELTTTQFELDNWKAQDADYMAHINEKYTPELRKLFGFKQDSEKEVE